MQLVKFFASKDKTFYKNGIQQFVARWKITTKYNSNYYSQ